MQIYVLSRTQSGDTGTFGTLSDSDGNKIAVTCEPSWKNNGHDSCIPPGTYICIRHDSANHPWTFEVTDVPDRSEILIHNGNTQKDSLGCILVGREMGELDGVPAVLNSDATLNKLRAIFQPPFQLTIIENLN